MFLVILFELRNKEIFVINLTVKEKNDLNEVHNCLLISNKLESLLGNIYRIIYIFMGKEKRG